MAHFEEKIKKDLSRNVAKGEWEKVMETFKKYPGSYEVKISMSGETALHIAVSNRRRDVLERIVSIAGINALAIGDERGNTPLHLAAIDGSDYFCRFIGEKDPKLIGARNHDGETPLFVAVSNGGLHTYARLQQICQVERHDYGYYKKNNGDTILHAAISQEQYGLRIAYCIINHYPKLAYMVNEDGKSPLHLLASKPSFFASGLHPDGQIEKFIYHRIPVSDIDLQLPDPTRLITEDLYLQGLRRRPRGSFSLFLIRLKESFRWKHHQHDEEAADEQVDVHVEYHDEEAENEVQVGRWENHQQDEEAANEQDDDKAVNEQDNQPTFETNVGIQFEMGRIGKSLVVHLLVFIINVWLLVHNIGGQDVDIRYDKILCTWSVRVMNEILKHNSKYEQGGMQPQQLPLIDELQINLAEISPIATPKVETALLTAARHGVVEMVEKILQLYPDAISDVNNEKKNIAMLAAEHRQTRLFWFLCNNWATLRTLRAQVDKDGNSALHIAAKLGDGQRPWRIRGAALQMSMEILWYKLVEDCMPSFSGSNRAGQAPEEIFRETHRDLVKESRELLTHNSQSCSVVAALIATVAFATSANLTGGFKQDSGTPTLENDPIFIISAVSSLIALCSSMISVIVFLGILTSNFQQEDFRDKLPSKHSVGMISLLVSIVSMLISFFAGHHFVLKQQLKHASLPVYILLCLPLLYFIISRFPFDYEKTKLELELED